MALPISFGPWSAIRRVASRRTEVFELPFMMSKCPRGRQPCVLGRCSTTHMKDTEFKDVHILGAWVHGPGMLHTARTRSKRPSDLQGMKIRGGSRSVNATSDRADRRDTCGDAGSGSALKVCQKA